jgi:hypothetical protein
MTDSFTPNTSENPVLVPASELPREWIDNYLKESAVPRGQEIENLAVAYPRDAPQFRFVFSGAGRERVEAHVQQVNLAAVEIERQEAENQGSLPDQASEGDPEATTEAEAGARGAAEELPQSLDIPVLPELDLPVDLADESYVDAYYAALLREYPDRILVTVEPINPDGMDDKGGLFIVDPPIEVDQVHHYRARLATTGATAKVTLTSPSDSGSVEVQLWGWFIHSRNPAKKLRWKRATAGTPETEKAQVYYTSSPSKRNYDVAVVGRGDGPNTYTIVGNTWEWTPDGRIGE